MGVMLDFEKRDTGIKILGKAFGDYCKNIKILKKIHHKKILN